MFTQDNIIVVINPKAGKKKGYWLKNELENLSYQTYLISDEFCLENIENKLLVIAGGDGTIHHVLNVLYRKGLHSKIRLAILPIGTGNDLARSLGFLSSRFFNQLKKGFIEANNFTELPLWSAECFFGEKIIYQRVFLNYCSTGFDAVVQAEVNRSRQNIANQGAIVYLHYFYFVFKHFFYSLPKCTILTINNKIISIGNFCSVVFTNIDSYAGGIRIEPKTEITSMLQLFLIKTKFKMLRFFFKRFIKSVAHPETTAQHFSLSGADCIINLDGETHILEKTQILQISCNDKISFLSFSS